MVERRGAERQHRLSRISAAAHDVDVGRVVGPGGGGDGALVEEALLQGEDLVGVLTKGRCGSAFARRPAVILEGNRHDVEGVTAAAFQFAYVPVGLRLDMFVHLQRSQLWRPCAREALELSDPERERPLSEAAIELVDRLARMRYARLPVGEPGIGDEFGPSQHLTDR